jgi:polysaccharide biosynthesis transport protein
MAEKELTLLDYFEMLRRHKWIVIASFFAALGLGALYSFRATPMYRSSATILIERETPRVVEASEVVTLGSLQAYGDYYNTQIKILESRDIMQKAAALISRDDISVGALRVEPVRNSWMVKLSAEHPDPEAAALLVNTVAEVFVNENLERKMRTVGEAQTWLSERLAEAETKLQESEKTLEDFRQKTGEISLEQAQDITVTRMKELNSAHTRAQEDRIAAESRYSRYRDMSVNPGEEVMEIVDSALIQDLRRSLIEKENEYRKLSERLTPSHHEMVRLSAQIEDIRDKITVEQRTALEALTQERRREYESALKRENDLMELLNLQKEKAMLLSRTAVDYNILKRSADTSRELYQMLLTQAQETGLTGELRANNISILDRAQPGRSPVSPNTPRNLLASALMGLIAGAGLVFFTEYMHNTVNSSEDLTESLGAEVKILSSIPHIIDGDKVPSPEDEAKIVFACGSCSQKISIDKKYAGDSQDCPACKKTFVVPADSQMPGIKKLHPHAHNAFGLLRTNLLYPPPDKPMKNILITSAVRNDGKTFAALNLAIAFADIGFKTLIVGTDLRKPRMDKIFKLKSNHGLSHYLVGEATAEEVIHELPVENLSVVPCGRTPSSSELLLSSPKMQEFSSEMKKRFDYIIYDSPPIAPVADAILLSASIADRTILVARMEKTPMRLLKQAYQMLREAGGGEVAGVILNDIPRGGTQYYYRYYKYYKDYESDKAEA